MLSKKLSFILFFIILIEGFFTLSLELLVIRQTIPFVGNGTEMVSIIISSVLFPLSVGYYYGGKKYSSLFKKNNKVKIRNILIKNIFIITMLSGFGFSYIVMDFYFKYLNLSSLMLSLSIYLFFFLAIPTYLLGQTVPLLSNYFSSEQMSKVTGKILFISTAGSFLGSIITVLILMRFIGVSSTLILIELLLLSLTILISKNKIYPIFISSFIIIIIILFSSLGQKVYNIEYENTYNTVSVIDSNETRLLMINNSYSSMTSKNNTVFWDYVNVINKIIKQNNISTPKDILVIGAGGFTIGFNDTFNNYIYVDLDENLKDISENKFLKEKLKDNKTFYIGEIRKYLNESDKKYDLIIVDAYTNRNSIPFSLVTMEFYTQIKTKLKKDGVVISNIITDMFLNTKYARNMDLTIRKNFSKVIIIPLYDQNKLNLNKLNSINSLYILKDVIEDKAIYTDDLNQVNFDTKKI